MIAGVDPSLFRGAKDQGGFAVVLHGVQCVNGNHMIQLPEGVSPALLVGDFHFGRAAAFIAERAKRRIGDDSIDLLRHHAFQWRHGGVQCGDVHAGPCQVGGAHRVQFVGVHLVTVTGQQQQAVTGGWLKHRALPINAGGQIRQ